MSSLSEPRSTCFCPHRWAICLTCATFPLVWVGGLVTTTDAGMAVPDWPTTYGYNLLLYPWQTWLFGPWDLFVEHGHRLLATLVGMLTIALLASLWRSEDRRWVKYMGILALLLVIAQGVLGGMRVLLDERLLALIHGCTGPLFFALTVGLAVVTSRSWKFGDQARHDMRPASRRRQATVGRNSTAGAINLHTLAFLCCGLVYVQIVLGALLRHMPVVAEPATFATVVQFHLLFAGLIALTGVALAWIVMRSFGGMATLRNLSLTLLVLVAVEILLGAATWAVKYSVAHWVADPAAWAGYTIQAGGWLQTHVVTAHVALGSLLFATSVGLFIYSLRLVPMAVKRSHGANRGMGVAA